VTTLSMQSFRVLPLWSCYGARGLRTPVSATRTGVPAVVFAVSLTAALVREARAGDRANPDPSRRCTLFRASSPAPSDHAGRQLATGLVELGFAVAAPDTNIVWIDPSDVGREAGELQAALGVRGVRLSRVEGRLRAVTHLDVDRAGITTALERIARELADRAGSRP